MHPSNNVALILNPEFGTQVNELAKNMPVWIVSSPTNDHAIKVAREEISNKFGITTLFLRHAAESPSNILLRALYDIDEHHGLSSSAVSYDSVLIFGDTTADALTPEVMRELAFQKIEKTNFGLMVSK